MPMVRFRRSLLMLRSREDLSADGFVDEGIAGPAEGIGRLSGEADL